MTKENLVQIFSRFPANKKDGLIPILQEIQNQHGYLTEELLTEVGLYLHVPANKLYGVATFYDQFRFHPHGRYHFRICRGTACHLFGSSTLLRELEQQLKVKAGQITKDRKFSLEITNCLGGCQSAPVLCINDQYYTSVSADELTRIIHSLREKTD
jgi:NADH-quinone oxidoreductase E subunit